MPSERNLSRLSPQHTTCEAPPGHAHPVHVNPAMRHLRIAKCTGEPTHEKILPFTNFRLPAVDRATNNPRHRNGLARSLLLSSRAQETPA